MIPPVSLSPGRVLTIDPPLDAEGGDPFVLPSPGKRQATGKTLPAEMGAGDNVSEEGDTPGEPTTGAARSFLPLAVRRNSLVTLSQKASGDQEPSVAGEVTIIKPAPNGVHDGGEDESSSPPLPLFNAVLALLLGWAASIPSEPASDTPVDPPLANPGLPQPLSASGEPAAGRDQTLDIPPAFPLPVQRAELVKPMPADALRMGAVHPTDAATLLRAERVASDTPAAAFASLAPAARHMLPASERPAPVAVPLPLVGAPAPAPLDARADGGGFAGEQPPPSPDRPLPAALIERVEFDTGPDGVTRLRLVHESVGRLLVTLDAGERTDVRLVSDDGAVRQTLADALPTLRRLADDRHLLLGTLEVTPSHIGADSRGRDAPADRRPAPQSAPVLTPTPRAVPRSTPSAGRSAGLFA